jgi:hypothetical protein
VRRAAAPVTALSLLLLCGCDDGERLRQAEEINRSVRSAPESALPAAFLVRFREASGRGAAREGWELEILQMGGDVRLRGEVRTGGEVIPIYRPLGDDEFRGIWTWFRQLPWEGWEPVEAQSGPEPGWRKWLEVDVVRGNDERVVSRQQWRRPLVDAPWVEDLETRFHLMALDAAADEIARRKAEGPTRPVPPVDEILRNPDRPLLDPDDAIPSDPDPDAD